MMTLEEYKKYLDDESLTDEQVNEIYNREKEKFDTQVNEAAGSYKKLDMDAFVERIGGYERVERMKKVNDKLQNSELINGKLVEKKNHKTSEDIEEWKRGFMDGFEEAYKRLHGNV